MLNPDQKLILYMEDSLSGPFGKMGLGLLRYSKNPIVAIIDSSEAGAPASKFALPREVPIVATLDEAISLGGEVFVLGIAPLGGKIPDAWTTDLDAAIAKGLCLVNGLHEKLAPRYPDLAEGQWVWDVRNEPANLHNGLGWAMVMDYPRVLMIGTDMAVGKMTAGLELLAAAQKRGIKSKFIATGQIGMTITGGGVPLDAIRLDFASGAIERELMLAQREEPDLVIIEGQGALCHPSSSATLPLLRGSMPTHLILCLKAGQEYLRGLETIKIPPLGDYIRLYEDLAAVGDTFTRPTTIGLCVNTSELTDEDARACLEAYEAELGLPATDPVRYGVEPLLDAIVPDLPTRELKLPASDVVSMLKHFVDHGGNQ